MKRLHTDGSPVLFCISSSKENGNIVVAYITSEKYFNRRKCLDDNVRMPKDISKDWANLMEAVCEWRGEKGNVVKAHQSMIDYGFTYSKELGEFINYEGQEKVYFPKV